MNKYLKITDNQRKDLISKAVDILNEGYSKKYSKDELQKYLKGKASEYLLSEIIKEACRIIKGEHSVVVKEVKALHVTRYNKIIKKCLATEALNPDDIVTRDTVLAVDEHGNIQQKTGISLQQYKKSIERKNLAYLTAITTMQQKENLLGLIKRDLSIEINNQVEIDINTNQVVSPEKWDISKLTFDEQVELLTLMKKAKKGAEEFTSIQEVTEEEKQETIDVVAEVLPPNVEQIKQVSLETKTEERIPNPLQRLKENLARIAAKKIQEAGGNLDDNEKKLIE